jgi:hypothetical protein
MNQRIYKKLRLIGAMTLCAGAFALKLESYAVAGGCLAAGILIFFFGIVGAWFNDG